MSHRPHVCFVAPHAWPVLARDRRIPIVGGAEVQQSIIAAALSKSGYRVSMMCLDYGQADRVVIDGVTVFKSHSPEAGWPVARFLHPRLTVLWRTLNRIGADIYYQRSAGVITGWVALFCRLKGRPFVYAVANDADLAPDLPLLERRRDRAIFRAGLRNAAALVVQNEAQQALSKNLLSRESTLIRSCYQQPKGAVGNAHGYVLWISTLREWKRPDLFLDVASRLPHLRFRMIGGADTDSDFRRVYERASKLANVDFLGYVPYADIESHFNGARLLVNTSTVEGFPNTFLRAWSRAIPSLSFVQPVKILSDPELRLVVRDIDELTLRVRELMVDDDAWRRAGATMRSFFREHHSVDAVVASYVSLFRGLGVVPAG